MRLALDVTVILSSLASVALVTRMLLTAPVSGPSLRTRWTRHPFGQLVLVGALLLANQLAFDVFVRASQAFLELPFVLFAYLSIARLLDRALYRSLTKPIVLGCASVAFTAPLVVAELGLRSPWTVEELVSRALACATTPLWIAWISRDERGGVVFPASESRPTGLVGLATFVTGALATAYLVLETYDVALLDDARHLDAVKGPLVASLGAATLAHLGDGRFDGFVHRLITASYGAPPPASPAVRVTTSVLAALTAVFFVPSLAVRCAGARPLAQGVGAVLLASAVVCGVVVALREARATRGEIRSLSRSPQRP